MRFGPVATADAEGAVLAHAVSAGGRTWRKATVLSRDDIAALRDAGIATVIAARLDGDDLDENEAARRLAGVLVAHGIEARSPSTGRVNLHARQAGVFCVDRAVVDAVNAIDPAITLATLPDFATVAEGRMVATVKVIPFAVPAALVERAVSVANDTQALRLHPFAPLHASLIQTRLPALKPSVLDKTARLTAQRLAVSGGGVVGEERCAHDEAALAPVLAARAREAGLVIVFGASAVADADDVIPAAIRRAGGRVERVGMPVDPGNLLVIGEIGACRVIGAPGCARSPKANGFDWVLDRLAAGLPVGGGEIAAMGVGGLLMEIESRPQPRESRAATGRVHAVLLAAGQGKRMGGPNKLLATFDGVPLARRMAEQLVRSRAAGTTVVLGHQADRIRTVLEGTPVRIAENPLYRSGLAGSLRAGIEALPGDAAAALVVLADMPGVATADLDRMIAAFESAGGRAIVRATHAGKRGNPVILPRALFGAVAGLSGDTGARHLIESSELPVIDVELGEVASLDVDTPEAMARAGGELAG